MTAGTESAKGGELSDLAVTSGDEILTALGFGPEENLFGVAAFDQHAEVKESRALRDARRLLHVVGDDDDGKALAQFVHQILEQSGSHRIER